MVQEQGSTLPSFIAKVYKSCGSDGKSYLKICAITEFLVSPKINVIYSENGGCQN